MSRVYDNYADLITFTRASSATYLDSDGLLKTASTNVPRIEYDSDGNRLGLLVEEARTNLVTYSEDFGTDAGWSWTRSTVTENAIAAPSGTTTADYLEQASGQTGAGSVARLLTISGSGDYTWSVFAKAAEKTFTRLQLTPSNYAHFNLSTGVTGTAVGCTASITDCGSGWYRCSITASLSANPFALFYVGDTDNSVIVTDSGGIYLWGGMFEAGSFPTSYIPTSGSTATRSADVASIGVSEFGYNQSEGTVFVEFQNTEINSTDRMVSINDGSGNNAYQIQHVNGTSTSGRIRVGATDYMFSNRTAISSGKAALLYSEEYAQFATDGSANSQDTTVATATMTSLNIGHINGASQCNGHIKSLRYFPRKLTESQLEDLTS
jgi:hypothetical protein